MRLGIVGCGAISLEAHLPSARRTNDVELLAVVDKDLSWAQQLARQYGAKYALANYEDLVDRVEAAIVASPSWTHADIACYLLEHGIHVLCEKPVGLTLAEGRRIFDAAAQHGTRVMAAHSRRFTDNAQALHWLVRAGCLGQIEVIEAAIGSPLEQWPARHAFRTSPALAGGGCLMDSGIHLIDLALWLMGSPADVSAYAATRTRGWDVEDDASLTLAFQNGAVARLAASYTHELSYTLALSGSGGWARMAINGEPGLEFFAREAAVGRTGGVQRLAVQSQLPYDAQLRHFCRCLESGEPFLVRAEEVLEGLRLIECCYTLGRDGQLGS